MAYSSRVYSQRLMLAEQSSSEFYTYTTPSGFCTVVKDVDLYAAAANAWLQLQIRTVGSSDFVSIAVIYANTIATSIQWKGRAVLNPGDTLGVYVNGSAGFQVSGFNFSLP